MSPLAPEYPVLHTHDVGVTLATGDELPAGQLEHAASPVVLLYMSATHAVQGRPVYPGLHGARQSLWKALPTCELVLTGQVLHGNPPVVSLYWPFAQSTHGPPFAPVAPALHRQCVGRELLSGELECSGQARQASAVSTAACVEYLPSTQFVHGLFPE